MHWLRFRIAVVHQWWGVRSLWIDSRTIRATQATGSSRTCYEGLWSLGSTLLTIDTPIRRLVCMAPALDVRVPYNHLPGSDQRKSFSPGCATPESGTSAAALHWGHCGFRKTMDASVPLGVHGTGHTVGSVFHLLCRTNYVVTSGGPCGDVCGPETNLGAIVARRTVGQGGGGHLFDTPFPGLLATAKSSTVVDPRRLWFVSVAGMIGALTVCSLTVLVMRWSLAAAAVSIGMKGIQMKGMMP